MKAIRAHHRGFTLIELIVVVVLLGVIAAVIVPRMAESPIRRMQSAAHEVGVLLSVAAHRDSVGAGPVAIEFDGAARALRMLVTRGGEVSGAGESSWIVDPLVAEAIVPESAVVRAWIDGAALESGGWRAAFSPSEPRRELRVALTLEGASDVSWIVALLPHATQAKVIAPGAQGADAILLNSIDLDAAGGGAAPW